MILTCPQCEIQYRLDGQMLGVGGRMVRCTACSNIWFQPPEQRGEPPKQVKPQEEDLLKQIGIGTEAPKTEADNFKDLLDDQARGDAIPDVVKPVSRDVKMPVFEYRPMGMGANQFGLFTFLLLVFLSVIFLFVIRAPLVQTFPAMAGLYKVLGFQVKAPGEGLRLAEMLAENRVDGEEKTLAVEAKLTNISEGEIVYPSLLITLKGPYGKTLQDWDFHPDKAAVLKSGETIPVKLEFKDADAEGKSVEMKVMEP